MGVVVAIARSVLFCAFGMAARPVFGPGMVAGAVIVSRMRAGMIGARALARLDLQLAERRDDRRLVDALLVIFDADAALGAGVGLQHAGHLAQGLAHSAGAALVPDSFDLPCRMAVSPPDIGDRTSVV